MRCNVLSYDISILATLVGQKKTRPCRHAGQSGVDVRHLKLLKNARHVRHCPVHLKKTQRHNAGHSVVALSSVNIQIKSEITLDATGQNAGLSVVTAGS